MRKLLLLIAVLLVANVWAMESGKAVEGARYQLQGPMIPGGLLLGVVPEATQVLLNGKPLTVSASGDFVFALDRDTASGDVLTFTYADGVVQTKKLQLEKRQYSVQRVNGISAAIASDDKTPETWERIRKEQVAVEQAKAQFFPFLYFKQSFIWPLTGPISGVFGSQRVYNGTPGTPHYGVDIAAAVGTPFVAPADGVVTLAEPDLYYSGGTVILNHGFYVSSAFLHMSKVRVKVGDVLKQGDVIGEVGATGRAAGPHLDWRMNWLERRFDPQLLVPPMPHKAK